MYRLGPIQHGRAKFIGSSPVACSNGLRSRAFRLPGTHANATGSRPMPVGAIADVSFARSAVVMVPAGTELFLGIPVNVGRVAPFQPAAGTVVMA